MVMTGQAMMAPTSKGLGRFKDKGVEPMRTHQLVSRTTLEENKTCKRWQTPPLIQKVFRVIHSVPFKIYSSLALSSLWYIFFAAWKSYFSPRGNLHFFAIGALFCFALPPSLFLPV